VVLASGSFLRTGSDRTEWNKAEQMVRGRAMDAREIHVRKRRDPLIQARSVSERNAFPRLRSLKLRFLRERWQNEGKREERPPHPRRSAATSPPGERCGVGWAYLKALGADQHTSPLGERSRRFAAGEGACLFHQPKAQLQNVRFELVDWGSTPDVIRWSDLAVCAGDQIRPAQQGPTLSLPWRVLP
jgi:hypothetical protein